MGAFSPNPRVEIAFGFGPYATGISWTDISSYVNVIHTHRGRDSELDVYPPGTCTLELDNHDRHFDPLNSSGPFFGDLVANVPVRIVAEYNSTDYPVWYGYVDGWPNEYSEGGFRKLVEVNCTDAFKLFGERSAPDVQAQEVDFLPGVNTVRRWYRFDRVTDDENTIVDAKGNGSTDLQAWGQWTSQERIGRGSARGALGHAQHTAPENTENRYRGATSQGPIGSVGNAPIQGDRFAIAFTVRVTDIGEMGGYTLPLMWIGKDRPDGGFVEHMSINLHHGGQHHPDAPVCPGCVNIAVKTGGPTLFLATGPGATNHLVGGSGPFVPATFNPFDGEAHTIIMERQTSSLFLWADGVLVGQYTNGASTGVATWDETYDLRVYWPFQGVPAAVGRTFPGVILQDMVFLDVLTPGAFSATDVHEWLMVGMEALTPSGTAVNSLLSEIGWPVLMRNLSAGETLVHTPGNPYGETVLELLQQYADTEGGRLFMAADGDVVFHAANRFETHASEAAVQYTFDDGSVGIGLVEDLRIVVDDDKVFEAAAVEREGGVEQYAASTDTPAKTYSLSGLRFVSDRQALQRAERIIHLYSTPQPRTDAWQMWPEEANTDWDSILSLEIGHRIAISLTPGGVGSAVNLEQHIELIEHYITPIDWMITMNGSPVDPSNYFRWGGTGAVHGWGNGLWR